MAKKFDMGEFAKTLKGPVSESDTSGREQITYIPLNRIEADGKNFYMLDGVEELAANIQLCGLQQPLRVRAAVEAGRYTIVSGHRRWAALQRLADDGEKRYRDVPCIVETDDVSPAMRELRLIYANSDTRVMTSAELGQQAERVEALLYQLKEEGVEFPGRMRDHVAEACKISRTKLANLKVIRDRLIPEFSKLYKKDAIAADTALALAQMPAEHQKLVFDVYNAKKNGLQYFYAWKAKDCGKQLKNLSTLQCKKNGGACTNTRRKFEHLRGSDYCFDGCDTKCCEKCDKLGSCKMACPLLADQAKKLREDARAQKRQEKQAKEEEDRPFIEQITNCWARFGKARAAAGKSVAAWYKHMNMYYSKDADRDCCDKESGKGIKRDTVLPYGYHYDLSDAEKLCRAADFLGCSVDYLLCRTDNPQPVSDFPGGQLMICGWMPGGTHPKQPCDVVAVFKRDGMNAKGVYYFDGTGFCFAKSGKSVEITPDRWMALPPEED